MPVQIPIPVADVDRLLALGYAYIEVWQSKDTGLTFSEVTAPAASEALLVSREAKNTYRVGGRKLRLRIDGGPVEEVYFSPLIEFWTVAQVVSEINRFIPGNLAYSVADWVFAIKSRQTGRSARLDVVYSDAHELGFETGQTERGEAARLQLAQGTLSYLFEDVAGTTSDIYKWRFSSPDGEPISEFSSPVLGSVVPQPGIPLSVGTARFVGVDGRPIRRTVLVALDGLPAKLNGFVVGDQSTKVYESDENGFLQIQLVRGAKVRVAFEGTTLVRQITVPDAPTFDLLQAVTEAPDPFTVQETAPLLNRRSI